MGARSPLGPTGLRKVGSVKPVSTFWTWAQDRSLQMRDAESCQAVRPSIKYIKKHHIVKDVQAMCRGSMLSIVMISGSQSHGWDSISGVDTGT